MTTWDFRLPPRSSWGLPSLIWCNVCWCYFTWTQAEQRMSQILLTACELHLRPKPRNYVLLSYYSGVTITGGLWSKQWRLLQGKLLTIWHAVSRNRMCQIFWEVPWCAKPRLISSRNHIISNCICILVHACGVRCKLQASLFAVTYNNLAVREFQLWCLDTNWAGWEAHGAFVANNRSKGDDLPITHHEGTEAPDGSGQTTPRRRPFYTRGGAPVHVAEGSEGTRVGLAGFWERENLLPHNGSKPGPSSP
jgi:hypothetical protein